MERKQDNIFIKVRQVLVSKHPPHNDRVWLAGYLLHRCYDDIDKVCKTIHLTNKWEDYNPETTEVQVKSVLRSKQSPKRQGILLISSPYLSGEVDKLAKEFDWDRAQKEVFKRTERMRLCLEKNCYLEPDCYERPCRWVTRS